MTRILVVGEDALCCALGERLIEVCLPGWELARQSIDTRGVSKLLPELRRFQQQAQYVQPVLCIADTDGACAREILQKWTPRPADGRFVFRLAVAEAESWLLADRAGFAQMFEVPGNRLPRNPDDEPDPKRVVLALVQGSRKRILRDEVIDPRNPHKPGAGYNVHMCNFVRRDWDAHRAAATSPSLQRAMRRLRKLGEGGG